MPRGVYDRGKGTKKESEWRELIERQEASGLSQPKFCAVEGLPESTFFRWHRRLKMRGAGKLVELGVPKVREGALAEPNHLEIEFQSGLIIRIRG